MQRRCRVEHGDHEALIYFLHLPMDLRDLGTLEEFAHRKTSERHNDTWAHDFNLVIQIIAGTGFNFIREWIAIIRRPTLDHICDPHICARHASLGKQLIQKLSGGAHERTPLLILVETWAFTDEHDLCLHRPFTWNRFFA